MVLIKQGIIFS